MLITYTYIYVIGHWDVFDRFPVETRDEVYIYVIGRSADFGWHSKV